jgi:hypothetical protein
VPEGIVYVSVAELGELLGEVRVVLLLFLVKAQVLQQQHAAVRKRAGRPFDGRADAIVDKSDRLAEQLASIDPAPA